MGTYTPLGYTWDHEGTTYYFCSLGCFEKFKADPEGYRDLDDSQRHM